MNLQNDFANGIDKMHKIAYSLVKGNARAWASKAERKGIININEKIEINNLVDMRVFISHGGAGKLNITSLDVQKVNYYIKIMNNTAGRFQTSDNNDMPLGTFRNYLKEFNYDGRNGRKYYFKFEIVYEYQERAYDDGTIFSGKGYTIYVINAPYRQWCLDNNTNYEFHYYSIPRGSESICWNRLVISFEDANKIMYVWAKRYIRIIDDLLDHGNLNVDYYDNNQRRKHSMPTGTFRIRHMRITEDVFCQIKKTLGTMKPEQGGILGISNDSDLIDTFVHDKTAKVGHSEYNPNVFFLNDIINNQWSKNNIDFCGFVHSHPSQSNMLSDADIEYAIRIMKEFDLAYLYMPLVNSSVDGKFEIYYFFVNRDGKTEKVDGSIEKCEKDDVASNEFSSLSEDEIMNIFETSKAKPVKVEKYTQFDRIESCLPLDYLKQCVVVGIGCGGAREFYIDMARMGVMNYSLMDGDVVSITNIASQNVYLNEIDRKKVNVIKEKLLQINENINVQPFPLMLDDSLDDKWFEDNILNKYKGENVLLCAFTDSFNAQARVANIAIKYKLPYLSAQHHQYGETSEIVYWYPEISKTTPKSILKTRYSAYESGYKNIVTSDGSPIFNTVRLNALCEKIAVGMFLYSYNKYNGYCNFLVNSPEKNLILIRQCSLIGSNSSFVNTFNNKDTLFDDPIWIENDSDELYEVEDSRKIFK